MILVTRVEGQATPVAVKLNAGQADPIGQAVARCRRTQRALGADRGNAEIQYVGDVTA